MTASADRTATEDGITAQSVAAQRSAMARLFAGRAQRTDGRLTKESL